MKIKKFNEILTAPNPISEIVPEVGDYIIADPTHFDFPEISKLVENYIGTLDKIIRNNTYYRGFKTFNTGFSTYFNGERIILAIDDILFFSKDEEACEAYINAKKYNL